MSFHSKQGQEKGISLIEAMITLTTFALIVAGSGYILIQGNRQNIAAERLLAFQQYAMQQSASQNMTAATLSTNLSMAPITVTVSIMQSTAVQNKISCSPGVMNMGAMMNFFLSFFEPPVPAAPTIPSAIPLSVPMVAITSPASSSNINSPNFGWWLP